MLSSLVVRTSDTAASTPPPVALRVEDQEGFTIPCATWPFGEATDMKSVSFPLHTMVGNKSSSFVLQRLLPESTQHTNVVEFVRKAQHPDDIYKPQNVFCIVNYRNEILHNVSLVEGERGGMVKGLALNSPRWYLSMQAVKETTENPVVTTLFHGCGKEPALVDIAQNGE